MDKTGSRQIIKLLLVVLGIAIFAVSYLSIRPKLTEKTTELGVQSAKLAAQLTQLTDLETNEATYSAKTKEYEAASKKILDKYPANVLTEDVILYAREMIGNKEDMSVSVVGITETERLFGMNDGAGGDASADAAGSAGAELGIMDYASVSCPNYELFAVGGSYDFVAGYEDVKTVLAYILADPDKRNVPSMSLTYESETGLLAGNLGVQMLYITGTDKVYKVPSTGDIPRGTTNIFGTIATEEETEGQPEE